MIRVASSGRSLLGSLAHVDYSERDTHAGWSSTASEKYLSAEDGPQTLQIDVDVTRVDGENRPDAHLSQSIVLRQGDQPYYAWIKGVVGQFDRVTVRVSHSGEVNAGDGTHAPPSVQWSIVFGTGHLRLHTRRRPSRQASTASATRATAGSCRSTSAR